jgi:hypothetical protein
LDSRYSRSSDDGLLFQKEGTDMTDISMREFYEKEVAWYKHQVEFDEQEIAWDNEQLKRSRKEDRELLEYVWSKGPLTEWHKAIYGDPKKYQSPETKKILASRRRWYRMKKRDLRNLQDYQKRLEAIS